MSFWSAKISRMYRPFSTPANWVMVSAYTRIRKYTTEK